MAAPSSTSLQVALDDAGKVLKKQKTCAARTDACVEQLISLVAAARAQLVAGGSPQVVSDLQEQVKKLGLEKEMTSQTKELHTAVGKLSKVRVVFRRAVRCVCVCMGAHISSGVCVCRAPATTTTYKPNTTKTVDRRRARGQRRRVPRAALGAL